MLYIISKKEVGINKVVKVIHLGFRFLKKKEELIIVTLTRFVVANITSATIHKILKIGGYTQIEKQRIPKRL